MKKSLIGILGVLGTVAGISLGLGITLVEKKKSLDMLSRYKEYYNLLSQWLILKNKNISLERYFIENKYNKIAVFGMGILGERFCEELKDSEVNIEYIIDRQADCIYSDYPIKTMDEKIDKVDAIVVTATYAFEDIKKELEQYVNIPVVSLKDIVFTFE